VPLSDHEQKILAELEESLNREDPEFADKVRNEHLYRHSGRQARWAAFAFLVGLVLTVWLFVTSLWLALVGVAIMFASAVIIQRNVRRMGRAGWHDITRGFQSEGPSGAAGIERNVHEARDWFKNRFRRDVD
jgi:Flp pilus assembly protein TadB